MKKKTLIFICSICTIIIAACFITLPKQDQVGTPGSVISEEPINNETEKEEPIKEGIPESTYDGIPDYFELRDQELLNLFEIEIPDDQVGMTWQQVWNGTDAESLQHVLSVTEDEKIIYDTLLNEDHTRAAIVAINFIDPDHTEFDNMIKKLDYHPEKYRDVNTQELATEPYGYIAAWDSFIAVNGNFSTLDYFYSVYSENLEGFPVYDNYYSLFNLEGYAHVLGIDIQDALADINSITDISNMYSNLMDCEYYGVRGYDSYLNTNPFGVIIKNYADLKSAVSDYENGPLSEVYYLSNEGGSDPTTDPDSEYYEAPIDGPSAQTASNYPPKVNEYMSYGYKVYKHNMCDAYYYKEAFDRYVLFCIDNRDIAKGAWAESIADSVYTSTFGVLTAIN